MTKELFYSKHAGSNPASLYAVICRFFGLLRRTNINSENITRKLVYCEVHNLNNIKISMFVYCPLP